MTRADLCRNRDDPKANSRLAKCALDPTRRPGDDHPEQFPGEAAWRDIRIHRSTRNSGSSTASAPAGSACRATSAGSPSATGSPAPNWSSRARDLTTRPFDMIHVFTASRAVLETDLPEARERLAPDGMIWVSWPKKASKVPTDVTEDVIRDAGAGGAARRREGLRRRRDLVRAETGDPQGTARG